ncbi:MOG interacting and ectopic P-granules protein 1-like isoform X2 [Physella acuta]|nr:MOG interacting and ectopic P-granules protein 1-like isoform X2 [Physella acuta]
MADKASGDVKKKETTDHVKKNNATNGEVQKERKITDEKNVTENGYSCNGKTEESEHNSDDVSSENDCEDVKSDSSVSSVKSKTNKEKSSYHETVSNNSGVIDTCKKKTSKNQEIENTDQEFEAADVIPECDKIICDIDTPKQKSGATKSKVKPDDVENIDSSDGDDITDASMNEKDNSLPENTSEKDGDIPAKKDKEGDSEKENKKKISTLDDNSMDVSIEEIQEKEPDKKRGKRSSERLDSAGDDIEIIGESKVVQVNTNKNLSQNVVFVPASLTSSGSSKSAANQGFTATNSNLLITSSLQNPVAVQNIAASAHANVPSFLASGASNSSPGFVYSAAGGQVSQGVSLLTPIVAPPKPKSSLDQIELIRWEIQNRINTRPKYFKPNSSSELGPLAKFLFDIGSDLIKESVYHDLVKIQSKKNDDETLTDKERDDLEKLKEIEKDLYATIGHLKLKLKKRCNGCNFQTESNNVMFLHKQYPHEDNKNLKCAHCSFITRQVVTFKFHLEAEHGVQPKLPEKRAFFECDMCPYENNQQQKLILHKQRCIKQFRPLFNLHPGCLSGAEINLCLENIFYKPVIPKNLKILQQKHAQQQAALAEARRQQAQMQALAAQKNAAAIAQRKQQLLAQQKFQAQHLTPRITAGGKMPVPPKVAGVQQPQIRYNVRTSRPTVANMLNVKQNQGTPPASATPNSTAGGFEVCEICGGYVKDRKALRIHFFYAHRIDLPFNLFERHQAPLYCATCYVRFWTAQGLRKHIDTHKEENQTRGVVGKCISCGHHVLNLLLHMRIVHNREMQHYINALMCMFCGGHFTSRQECERHIVKTHGTIDPLTGALKSGGAGGGATPPAANTKIAVAPKKTPGTNSSVKGSVCVLCNLNFGRNVDLTRHCMRMHHTCMKCGMVVIDKASLMKHTCLSSPSGTRDCTMCSETGFHPAYYVKHLRDKHLKKFSVKISKLSKRTIEKWTKRPYPFEDPEEILVEISDSDEEKPRKKRRMGPACKVGRRRENYTKSDVVLVKDDDDSEVVEVENQNNSKTDSQSDSATHEPKGHKEEESISTHQTKVDSVQDINTNTNDAKEKNCKDVENDHPTDNAKEKNCEDDNVKEDEGSAVCETPDTAESNKRKSLPNSPSSENEESSAKRQKTDS